MAQRIRARARAEHGQSLVIVVVAMTAVLGMAALGIDVGSWYLQHHRAQVAADGAALAAANCMANAGTPGNACTSTTDSTNATAQATTYAANNNVPIPSTDVSVSLASKTVTVTTPNPSPGFFSKLFHINVDDANRQSGSFVGPAHIGRVHDARERLRRDLRDGLELHGHHVYGPGRVQRQGRRCQRRRSQQRQHLPQGRRR